MPPEQKIKVEVDSFLTSAKLHAVYEYFRHSHQTQSTQTCWNKPV